MFFESDQSCVVALACDEGIFEKARYENVKKLTL